MQKRNGKQRIRNSHKNGWQIATKTVARGTKYIIGGTGGRRSLFRSKSMGPLADLIAVDAAVLRLNSRRIIGTGQRVE